MIDLTRAKLAAQLLDQGHEVGSNDINLFVDMERLSRRRPVVGLGVEAFDLPAFGLQQGGKITRNFFNNLEGGMSKPVALQNAVVDSSVRDTLTPLKAICMQPKLTEDATWTAAVTLGTQVAPGPIKSATQAATEFAKGGLQTENTKRLTVKLSSLPNSLGGFGLPGSERPPIEGPLTIGETGALDTEKVQNYLEKTLKANDVSTNTKRIKSGIGSRSSSFNGTDAGGGAGYGTYNVRLRGGPGSPYTGPTQTPWYNFWTKKKKSFCEEPSILGELTQKNGTNFNNTINIRGGSSDSKFQACNLLHQAENNDLHKKTAIFEIHDSPSNLENFFKLVVEHQSRIKLCLCIGGLVYIIFKKKKYVRKFLSKLSKLYKKIKSFRNKQIFTNRFSRGTFTLIRCCLKTRTV